ncbi:MAG: MFS transporter [Propionibacteriaceae bacterium]|nr:MFS transporter [Propionibacteriaceae bacterium]
MTQSDSTPDSATSDGLKAFADQPLSRKLPLTVSLMVGVVAVAFESLAVTTAMPSVFDDLGHMSWYAWAFSLFMIGQVFATVVAGRLCDRSGAMQPLGLGLAFFGVGLVVAATSRYALWFLAARLIQGFGGGLLTVSVMVVLAEAYAGPQRANLMAIFAACYMGPAFIGPSVAGWMTNTIGWRWVFWTPVPLVLASAILGVRPLWRLYGHRVGGTTENNPVPLWAAGLAALGVSAMEGGGQFIADNGVRPSYVLLALAGLAAIVVALPRLMPSRSWWRGRGLSAVIGVRFSMAGVFYVAQSFIVLLLKEQRGMSESEAGIALAIGAVGYGIGVFVQGRTWMRLRRDQIILYGSLSALLGVALMTGYAAMRADIYPLILIGISFTALGMGFSVSSTSLVTMTLSPLDRIGRNTSSLQIGDYLGSAFLSGTVAGTIYAALHNRASVEATFGWLFGVQLVFVLLAVWLATRIGPVRNESSGAD